mmetsp:Transcript_24991/g.27675  ORF Transcript_24991/g.27675 Transcript_24991/m.27675 type:complete len:106 (+) Transcript_24991:6-323(+)
MSKEGIAFLKKFEFPNLKHKYNILVPIYESQATPAVIEYANENRDFFAVWAYAALFIDHAQFSRFLYHSIISYKAQMGAVEEVSPLKLSDIEPITYARFLYEAGK